MKIKKSISDTFKITLMLIVIASTVTIASTMSLYSQQNLAFNAKQSTATFDLQFAPPTSTKMRALKGEFVEFDASLVLSNKIIAEFEASTKISDVNTKSKGRDSHLQKDDYFDAEKYPGIVLKLISYDNENNKLVAALTMKEMTKEVTFDSHLSLGSKLVSLTLTSQIKRLEYGVASAIKTSGRGSVSDEVDLTLKFVFDR